MKIKVKATLDSGEIIILEKDDVVEYQQKHEDCIFKSLEPEEEIRCQKCVSLFGEENAKMATVHVPGVITVMDHYCAEHFLESYPNYRIPMGDTSETCN